MCVLFARVGPDPFLAANRDEAYARPFAPPRRWVAETPFWAPVDEEEGGSWIGVNRRGLVAAVTNRSRLPEAPGRASRGLLVTGALARPDLGAAAAWAERELRDAPRNPCQLLLVESRRALLFRVAHDVEVVDLPPGLHVLSNLHEPDEIAFDLPPGAGWEEVRPILADPAPRLPRGVAACKRAGWRGTVASALIEPGRRFLFAGGPPDETAYEGVRGYPGGEPEAPS